MSVAFRRESDEEHLEPRFDVPIPPGPNLVTPRGKALIEAKIDALELALAGIAADGADAIRRDLRYWHTRRTTAIETAAPTAGGAGFGSVVDVRMGGRQRTIAIVGDDEAEPGEDRIGYTAPLARALLGAEPGDCLAFNGRDDAIEIVAVR